LRVWTSRLEWARQRPCRVGSRWHCQPCTSFEGEFLSLGLAERYSETSPISSLVCKFGLLAGIYVAKTYRVGFLLTSDPLFVCKVTRWFAMSGWQLHGVGQHFIVMGVYHPECIATKSLLTAAAGAITILQRCRSRLGIAQHYLLFCVAKPVPNRADEAEQSGMNTAVMSRVHLGRWVPALVFLSI